MNLISDCFTQYRANPFYYSIYIGRPEIRKELIHNKNVSIPYPLYIELSPDDRDHYSKIRGVDHFDVLTPNYPISDEDLEILIDEYGILYTYKFLEYYSEKELKYFINNFEFDASELLSTAIAHNNYTLCKLLVDRVEITEYQLDTCYNKPAILELLVAKPEVPIEYKLDLLEMRNDYNELEKITNLTDVISEARLFTAMEKGLDKFVKIYFNYVDKIPTFVVNHAIEHNYHDIVLMLYQKFTDDNHYALEMLVLKENLYLLRNLSGYYGEDMALMIIMKNRLRLIPELYPQLDIGNRTIERVIKFNWIWVMRVLCELNISIDVSSLSAEMSSDMATFLHRRGVPLSGDVIVSVANRGDVEIAANLVRGGVKYDYSHVDQIEDRWFKLYLLSKWNSNI